MKKNDSGFTLIELILVILIASTLSGLVVFSLIGTEKTSEINTETDVIASDLSSQQTKAMLGAGSSSGTSYGIHFESDKYVLFAGDSYNVLDSKNFIVNIESGYQLSSTFPAGDVIFTFLTGTVSGFLNGNNSVTIHDINGNKTKTITINRFGVINNEN